MVTVQKFAKTSILLACTGALAGCLGPTYGTGKSSGQHLMDDVGGILSLAPANRNDAPIEYTPRPDIVKPADTNTLPAPQQSIAATSTEWPESPEEKRQRILTNIEEGNRPANFITSRDDAAALGASEGPGRGSTAGQRVFLTDPPTEYRIPAQTAAIGEVGQTEASKERARKRAQGKNTGWRRLLPWL